MSGWVVAVNGGSREILGLSVILILSLGYRGWDLQGAGLEVDQRPCQIWVHLVARALCTAGTLDLDPHLADRSYPRPRHARRCIPPSSPVYP